MEVQPYVVSGQGKERLLDVDDRGPLPSLDRLRDDRLDVLWRLGTGPGEIGVPGESMEFRDDGALLLRIIGASAVCGC